MALITCTACGEEKAESEFYNGQRKCKPCFLARQKELKAAKKGGDGTAAKGGGKAKSKRKAAAARAADPPTSSRWEQPGGFGFAVELTVDENTRQTDIHIEQTTASLGEQNIWLSQHEARSLRAWLDEKLGAA